MRERAATGALVARRSRGASGAAACAPARPPRRSRGPRGELSKSSQERGRALYCCNGRRVAGAVCYGPRASPARCPAARARSGGGPRLPWGPPMR